MTIVLITSFVLSYIIGSIPTAVWIGKKFYNIDVREHGSKNAGATNTFRILGKKAGLTVFIIDVAKGIAAVSTISLFYNQLIEYDNHTLLKIICGAFAIIGHIFPLFAGFNGGKGVATMLGTGIGIHPFAALICFILFIIILLLTKYVSLGSISAGIAFALLSWFVFKDELTMNIFATTAACLLLFTHKKNIIRLVKGVENKTFLIKPNNKN